MQDATKPSFILSTNSSIDLKISTAEAIPTLSLSSQPSPRIDSISDIAMPAPTPPPPTPGTQTNFSVGWWLYTNNSPYVPPPPPAPTNFGEGWFMYQNAN